ncbi:MAG: GDP-mannose 4,6-dehydratase [Solirubrobacterales bacterium]|nr:GDP-mannose 4,6-dehydratase [Solirubrobacterales bacterium]MCB8970308.1 GDP-mannose 4,6-dehydratase [Thermoleophilales bacterium]
MAAADDKQVGARALVTGGAGFIGSHIVDGLLARGDAVRVVDDLSSGSEANLEGALAAGAELEVADVSDRAAFADAVAGFAPNVIFHLAAQADVRRSVADPEFDARVNVIGTINALEIARSVPGCRFVFSATGGAVYGEGDEHPLPFREDFPVEPLTPYGASKLAAEGYIATFQRLHAVPGAALRFGNVYGPRQDPHGEAGVVAIFCGRILDGAPPTIFGDGSQTRDYIYVDDVVAACLAADAVLASGRVINGPINVGTGVETSVVEVLEALADASGSDGAHELAPARKGELHRVSIDPATAAAELDWRPAVDIREGLARTYESVAAERA